MAELRHNLSAERDPTRNHDSRHGYDTGSVWRVEKTNAVWFCLKGEANKAEWIRLSFDGLAKVATSGKYADLDDRPKLGGVAGLEVGQSKGTVAAADDARITGALQADRNLKDVKDRSEALRALGVSKAAEKVVTAETPDLMQKALGLDNPLTLEQAKKLFQPLSEALTKVSALTVGRMVTLIAANDKETVQQVLGLRVGYDVQPHKQALTALAQSSKAGIRVATAPSEAAIRNVLGVDPGKDFIPAHEAREAIRSLQQQIDDLKRKVGS